MFKRLTPRPVARTQAEPSGYVRALVVLAGFAIGYGLVILFAHLFIFDKKEEPAPVVTSVRECPYNTKGCPSNLGPSGKPVEAPKVVDIRDRNGILYVTLEGGKIAIIDRNK